MTGRRNAFKEAGLRGLPLTFDSFRGFNKAYDLLEFRCPPNSRLSDADRAQLVGTLFIKDPTARKNWSDHINQPEIINVNGIRVSGPPRTYVEAKPMVCVVTKPIYGIPQAGRRLQRKIFPWCTEVMKLRQLDDSDDCVFVYDDPSGNETFSIGIYVDNMQIVHSAELNEDGDAVDADSFYAKFMKQLRNDWDVVAPPQLAVTCRLE